MSLRVLMSQSEHIHILVIWHSRYGPIHLLSTMDSIPKESKKLLNGNVNFEYNVSCFGYYLANAYI